MLSFSLLVTMAAITTVHANTEDNYNKFIRTEIVQPLLAGQGQMMELAEELMDSTMELHVFNGKMSALTEMMFTAAPEGMEHDVYMILAALEGKSPNLVSPEAKATALHYLRLFFKHNKLDALLLFKMMQQLTQPTSKEEMEDVVLKSIENELGVGSDELTEVVHEVNRVNTMYKSAEIKPVPPSPPPPVKTRCVTLECNSTMEKVYKFAEDKMLLPILGGHALVLQVAKMMMRAEGDEALDISSDYHFLLEAIGVEGTDLSWLRLACETIHNVYTQDEMTSFLATLKQTQAMGEGDFATLMSVVIESSQSPRDAEIAKRTLVAAIEHPESDLSPEQRTILDDVVQEVAVVFEEEVVAGGPKYPSCRKS